MEPCIARSYITGSCAVSSLGFSTEENYQALIKGTCGIRRVEDPRQGPAPVTVSLIDDETLDDRFALIGDPSSYTRLEKILFWVIERAAREADINLSDPRTLLIISTTKGNIDLLGKNDPRLFLWSIAARAGDFFKTASAPPIVSAACVSGALALLSGHRFCAGSSYDTVVVAGGDIITDFVLSGFRSLKALSSSPCRPFDRCREGITPGEGAAAMVLSALPGKSKVFLAGGASSNDANHISGPCPEGNGLLQTIEKALQQAEVLPGATDYIVAHGTGTPYNDEMEAKALCRAGLISAPVTGLKGYFGHTFGAAGIIESAMAVQFLERGMLVKTLGYQNSGVTSPLSVVTATEPAPLHNCLKTASGFSGINTSLVFKKI